MGHNQVPQFVETLQQRLELVEALVADPLAMRDLVETVDGSRSTVRRGVRDLESAGFVERVGDGYRATLQGRLAADTCREYIDQLRGIRELEEALSPLPPTFPINAAVVADSEAYVATGPDPYRPLQPIKDILPEMTRFRSMNATLPDPWFVEHIHSRTVDGDLSGEMIITAALADVLHEQFAEQISEMVETGRVRFLQSAPFRFGLLLADARDDTHVYLVIGNADGATHATLHAQSEPAREWAEQIYTEYREQATEVTGELLATQSDE